MPPQVAKRARISYLPKGPQILQALALPPFFRRPNPSGDQDLFNWQFLVVGLRDSAVAVVGFFVSDESHAIAR